jgi:uncharacterized phage protein gp47/JayE
MALELTGDGLTIQTLAEIQEELKVVYRQAFGNNVNLLPKSIFGQQIGIAAEREAVVQNTMLDIFKSWNPLTASGIPLDIIAELAGTERLAATRSTIDSGRITGTTGTVIDNGKKVKLDATTTEWQIINGPYTIPVSGTLDNVELEAVNTGPLTAVATGPSGWTIVTPVVGWTDFENPTDAELGRDLETDAEFRVRRIRELASAGRASLPAITANLSQVDGVTFARTYENTTLVTDGDGIPGKAINAVVEGGTDQDVADELFASKAAGIEAYGTDVTATVIDDEGNSHTIKFDRVSTVNIWIKCTLTTSTSEETFPSTGAATVAAALLDYGNDYMRGVGQDVLAYKLVGAVEDSGVEGIDQVAVLVKDADPPTLAKQAIGLRDRANYDSTRISVVEV